MFEILNTPLADKGFYINLDQSIERNNNVLDQVNKYNIKELYRHKASTDELHHFSCTKSHLKVFENALNENLNTIFVAEDDFQIEDECYFPRINIQFINALDCVYKDLKTCNWDVIMFGCNPQSYVHPLTKNLGIVEKSTGAWAYLIKRNAYQYILENSNYKRDYIAIDDYLPLLNSRGFISLMTIPILINHGVGFVSTLQPSGPVNYNVWIQGNYDKHLYSNLDIESYNIL